MRLSSCLLLPLFLIAAAASPPSAKRSVRYSDLSPESRKLLAGEASNQRTFDRYVSEINRETDQRETYGEYDHLIFFALQSHRFTRRPGIEPALSAYEFVSGLRPDQKTQYLKSGPYRPPVERLPAAAAVRLREFIKAIERPTTDERLSYFRDFIRDHATARRPLFEMLYAEYARTMRFLYLKEFTSREFANYKQAAEFIASLYQQRGHSTDTQIEANLAVYVALGALRSQIGSGGLQNVLVVGPGLDFAPRTDLIDLFEPQSYQPFAIADALLSLKLAQADRIRIHCIDINDRVIRFLQRFPKLPSRRLSIVSGVRESEQHSFSEEYKEFFQNLGKTIGVESPLESLPEQLSQHMKKSLVVRKEIAAIIDGDRLNIVTERYDPSPRYDLVVVTNVFSYFDNEQLLLALANIVSMLKDGGYLIHNEARPELATFSEIEGLPLMQNRTVLIASGRPTPLYDSVWIHKKATR